MGSLAGGHGWYGAETMEAWDGLRALLAALQRDPRTPLRGSPDPRQRQVPPPFPIRLQPWAVDVAAQIYRDYGTDVDLTVGFLHYPDRRLLGPGGIEQPPRPVGDEELLPEVKLSASLDEPIAVASGHSTHSTLRLHNHQGSLEVLNTNGNVTARVLDPCNGAVVGGYDGAQHLPLVTFQIPPGESATIPLLLGTASLVGDLGYAIPLGQWAFDVILELHRGRYRIPPLPLTVDR